MRFRPLMARKLLRAKAKPAKAAKKPKLPEYSNLEPLAPKGRAVSFCADAALGGCDADLGGPWKSRREICASPAQRRHDGRRPHGRSARLRSVDEEIPQPHR